MPDPRETFICVGEDYPEFLPVDGGEVDENGTE
jgi:hypothetical protein